MAWKARNWSSGCSGARSMFSASETSSISTSALASRHDAGDRCDFGEALLLHQQFQRPEAAAAGGHLEHAGLLALGIHDRADMQALDEAAAGDGSRPVPRSRRRP
jgi:hypothetical protein